MISESTIGIIGCIALLVYAIYKVCDAIRAKRDECDWDNAGCNNRSTPTHGELLSQDSFWACDDCGAKFRIPSGETPSTCPSCGEPLVEIPVGFNVEDEATPYICPHCGPYALLDGDDSDSCPVCGSSDVTPGAWLLKWQARWICSTCSQEFTAPSMPTQCPHCGEKFQGVDGEVDEESTVNTCRFCGEKIEMLDGEEMKFCPKCRREQARQ